MHRDGSGRAIADIDAARREWLAEGRTKTTYCSKREWDAWTEDFGELAHKTADGTEIRKNATVKAMTRGGTCKIVHCCVIIGNPAKYREWADDPNRQGWCAEWTFYPAAYLDTLIARNQ